MGGKTKSGIDTKIEAEELQGGELGEEALEKVDGSGISISYAKYETVYRTQGNDTSSDGSKSEFNVNK